MSKVLQIVSAETGFRSATPGFEFQLHTHYLQDPRVFPHQFKKKRKRKKGGSNVKPQGQCFLKYSLGSTCIGISIGPY